MFKKNDHFKQIYSHQTRNKHGLTWLHPINAWHYNTDRIYYLQFLLGKVP